MNPLKGTFGIIGVGLGAFVVLFLALWTKDWFDRRNEPAFRKDADTAAAGTAAATGVAAKTDTVYMQGDTVYIRTRNALLNPGAGQPPATAEVRACFAAADDLRRKCEVRHVADVAVSDSLRKELKLWQDRPVPRVKRVQGYGELLYDFVHMAPVARLGATARVFGPVSLSAAGDLSVPPAGESRVTVRGLAGVRIAF